MEAEAEKARALEARRQEAATARLNSQREELRRRAAETEASRVAALVRELARQTTALDAARAQVSPFLFQNISSTEMGLSSLLISL